MFLRAQSVDQLLTKRGRERKPGMAAQGLYRVTHPKSAAYAHGAFETLVPLYDMQELAKTITTKFPKYEKSTAINALNKANLALTFLVLFLNEYKESIPPENPKS